MSNLSNIKQVKSSMDFMRKLFPEANFTAFLKKEDKNDFWQICVDDFDLVFSKRFQAFAKTIHKKNKDLKATFCFLSATNIFIRIESGLYVVVK